MARNVEIKARIAGIESVLPRARSFADGSAELIHYHRPDTDAAKLSDYVRTPLPSAAPLHEVLQRALGTLGRVRKRRWLLYAGQTRIHLDRVEGLGDFMELEVVLRDGQSVDEGVAIAESLMRDLGLAQAERIGGRLHGPAGCPAMSAARPLRRCEGAA